MGVFMWVGGSRKQGRFGAELKGACLEFGLLRSERRLSQAWGLGGTRA